MNLNLNLASLSFVCLFFEPLVRDGVSADGDLGAWSLAPPARQNVLYDRANAVFVKQIKRGTVIIHTNDKINPAIRDLLDMSLGTRIRLKNISADIQALSVHSFVHSRSPFLCAKTNATIVFLDARSMLILTH